MKLGIVAVIKRKSPHTSKLGLYKPEKSDDRLEFFSRAHICYELTSCLAIKAGKQRRNYGIMT